MKKRISRRLASQAIIFGVATAGFLNAPFGRAEDSKTAEQLKAARAKAVSYLKTTQKEDGSWTNSDSPGITGLVMVGLLRSGVPASDPVATAGLKYLTSFVQPDGGIYHPKSNHRNYETSITMLALSEVNQDGKYKNVLAAAEKYLRQQQWDEEEGKSKDDPYFGGAGYGSSSRPDLSNTQFLLEALKAAGAKSDDPAFQKALVFVSRTQNLESEHNTTPFAAKVNDGGFYYTPAAGGATRAEGPALPNGGLRSYASMTYAGLKSMIYCGVGPDDPRVKAAVSYLKKHYSVTENPGAGQNGLYYYYQTFAKSLHAVGSPEFTDDAGKKHDWRTELAGQLANSQQDNGSWVNKTPKWMEGDPNLATAYALMALSYCDKPLEAAPAKK